MNLLLRTSSSIARRFQSTSSNLFICLPRSQPVIHIQPRDQAVEGLSSRRACFGQNGTHLLSPVKSASSQSPTLVQFQLANLSCLRLAAIPTLRPPSERRPRAYHALHRTGSVESCDCLHLRSLPLLRHGDRKTYEIDPNRPCSSL